MPKPQFTFKAEAETKTYYCFETGERPNQMTLYLKKAPVDEAGIDPKKGITIPIEETK